jgi:hypothetical protein
MKQNDQFQLHQVFMRQSHKSAWRVLNVVPARFDAFAESSPTKEKDHVSSSIA